MYSGTYGLTDVVEGSPLDAGKLVLSATRTYAPVVQAFLKERIEPNPRNGALFGRCTNQSPSLLAPGLHVVKDNMMDIPVLFETIQRESGTSWEEMYKVFNMGHRLEVYTDEVTAQSIVATSRSFGIDAQIIGRVESKSGAAQSHD